MNLKEPTYKPLLLTTTIRSPERYKDLIKIFARYKGKTLSNVVVNNIMIDIISEKMYRPTSIAKNLKFKAAYDADVNIDRKIVVKIMNRSPQVHKELGFNAGWPSRFDTIFKFAKELGFIYYNIGEKIQISKTGEMLIESKIVGRELLEQHAFLNAFVKYQRINPFRKVLNDNRPLILLLNTLNTMHKVYKNFNGLSKKEISLIICWKNSNFKS